MSRELVVDDGEIQLLAMALAHLAHERPGWQTMTRDFAIERLGAGQLFDRFYDLRRATLRLPVEGDSILDVRRRVQEVNPVLWEMVDELCWPGGRDK